MSVGVSAGNVNGKEKKTEEEIEGAGPRFDPPVYIQRYTTVRDILYKEPGIVRVVDFGCADGKFLKYLKKLPFAEEVAAVDTNEDCLDYAIMAAQPLPWDYIFTRHRPLTIKIYEGNVAKCDSRIKGYDAVTCIELIEHLMPEDLEKLPENIFGYVRPKIAIITTPNRDFNVLFPGLEGFRHWDHKFEWTRSEFREWCESVVKTFPQYNVEYLGVGEAKETTSLGFCTQIAVFKRSIGYTSCSTVMQDDDLQPYKLLRNYGYPGRESVKQKTTETVS